MSDSSQHSERQGPHYPVAVAGGGMQLRSTKHLEPVESHIPQPGSGMNLKAMEPRLTSVTKAVENSPTATPSLNQMFSEAAVARRGTTNHNNNMDAEIARIKAEMAGIKLDAPGNTLNRSTTQADGLAQMTQDEVHQLAQMIERVCGIHIDETKQYLLETRLLKMVLDEGCNTYTEFIQLANGPRQDALRPKLIDAMTTKETLWFRDGHPFDTLRDHILPTLAEWALQKPVKIWSAACSTGQETYSIAMSVHEYVARHPQHSHLLDGQHLKILGTDVANSSIMLSRLGRYDGVAMARGISANRKEMFFTPNGRAYMVNPDVKHLCEFRLANLQHTLNHQLGSDFDLIFLRNVAIYFTREFKESLYQRLASMLRPDGILMIGATETMVGLETPFRAEPLGASTIYRHHC
jgi:chemotaxis protein methyltransferase CheR